MSEPKGLFDAAIKHLADSIRALEIHSPADTLGESRLYQKQASGLRIGLRVLEAAGKVDKHTVLSCFDCAWEYCFTPFACDIDNTGKACQRSKMSIRVLLDVLPDERKK